MNDKLFRDISVVFICSLVSIAVICAIGIPVRADQLALEVTDFEDAVFQLQNVHVFIESPMSCCSCPPKVVTLEGIEVMDGSEKYIIPWEVIEQIEKEDEDNDKITIFLTDGNTLNVELPADSLQILSGDTEDDAYQTLRIQKLKYLKVIR